MVLCNAHYTFRSLVYIRQQMAAKRQIRFKNVVFQIDCVCVCCYVVRMRIFCKKIRRRGSRKSNKWGYWMVGLEYCSDDDDDGFNCKQCSMLFKCLFKSFNFLLFIICAVCFKFFSFFSVVAICINLLSCAFAFESKSNRQYTEKICVIYE